MPKKNSFITTLKIEKKTVGAIGFGNHKNWRQAFLLLMYRLTYDTELQQFPNFRIYN